MKKLPDKAEIVEQIVTELGRPLRKDRSKAQACTAIERMIETLRVGYRHPLLDAASTRKAAKSMRKELESGSDAMPIPLKDCDRKHMTLREFRSALDFFESTEDGPSPKFDAAKYCTATFAYRLVKEFSQKPPSTALGGQVRQIGTFLYHAFSGEEDVELKRQTDAVCRNRRTLPDNGRLRRFVRKEGKLHEAYYEGLAIPAARKENVVTLDGVEMRTPEQIDAHFTPAFGPEDEEQFNNFVERLRPRHLSEAERAERDRARQAAHDELARKEAEIAEVEQRIGYREIEAQKESSAVWDAE